MLMLSKIQSYQTPKMLGKRSFDQMNQIEDDSNEKEKTASKSSSLEFQNKDEYDQKVEKLRDQLKLHYGSHLFKTNLKQINNALKKNKEQMHINLIEATPKRIHQKLGGGEFRGSKYRGVSKNKSKWQVSIIVIIDLYCR